MPKASKIASEASQAPLLSFKTQYDPHPRQTQNVGSGVKQLWSPKLQDDGSLQLIKAGTDDLYASIQSHKDSCDIHVLLKRYQNGDIEALSKVQGTYGDFTQMPKTFAEALNAMIAGEQMFNSLPVEVRKKFDFSLEKFILGMDDMPSWLEKVGSSAEQQSPASAGQAADPASGGSKEVSE